MSANRDLEALVRKYPDQLGAGAVKFLDHGWPDSTACNLRSLVRKHLKHFIPELHGECQDWEAAGRALLTDTLNVACGIFHDITEAERQRTLTKAATLTTASELLYLLVKTERAIQLRQMERTLNRGKTRLLQQREGDDLVALYQTSGLTEYERAHL